MNKWFGLIGTICLWSGSAIIGATTEDLKLIHYLAMVLLITGGVFTGLYIKSN